MRTTPIYFDNQSTTPLDPRVLEAMLPIFSEQYGNASSSSHAFGWQAADAVKASRETIATSIGGSAREIVFTSGATESNNLAIRGIAEHSKRRGDHLVSVTTEHKAVLDPLARLARKGYDVSLLPVADHTTDCPGQLDPQQVADAIRDDTALVSVMLANNEIGIIHPLAEIGAICRERGIPLHCDATQAVGAIPIDVKSMQIDLMSFSAHKIYGPKGVGALYVRRGSPRLKLDSQIDGGGQENGIRSGTLNTAGIVGFAKAIEIAFADHEAQQAQIRQLRNRLWDGLIDRIPNVALNGPPIPLNESPLDARLPCNLNASFALVDGESLMLSMGNLAVASGSACTSANPEPSHVLQALDLPDDLIRASLRFSLGRFNTEEEVDEAVEMVAESVERLRKMSSMS